MAYGMVWNALVEPWCALIHLLTLMFVCRFWRTSPGVWFTEAYFTENLTPLGYLYQLEFASASVGFTLEQYWLDIGLVTYFPQTACLVDY